MDAYHGVEIVPTAKFVDVSKYNLRCNRNISEKMTKKDFVYDIRRPIQTMRKFVMQKRPIILPIQLRRQHSLDSKNPQYTVISGKLDHDNNNDACITTARRTLQHECNFCHEPIATLLSLSTHVKFHCQRYCKLCYWILHENETMEQHIDDHHRSDHQFKLQLN